MEFKLRYYQQEAVDAAIAHVKKRLSPALLELATGAGKSLVVSELARFFQQVAPQKIVLCIAPSKELVVQNFERYTGNYGLQASMYCASAGRKCLRSKVIFASPQSAVGAIEKIAHKGVSAIIIDEAHGTTNTMQKLVDAVLNYEINGIKVNEKCRIIGMTATPYRMNTGYIYAIDSTDELEIHHDESKAVKPFYSKLLYRITAGELVANNYLSQVAIGDNQEHYDTSELQTDRFGNFTVKSMEKVFSGKTKTERIIQSVIDQSAGKMGVMVFAATISHAEEIMSYLPIGEAVLVTGKLKKKEREHAVDSFKAQAYKYIVNVDVLTTGFDAPHVDVIAVLRPTESAMLFQQIIGRGLRLHPEKEFALILDYAENIERHQLQSDIFTPEIKAKPKAGEGIEIEVTCPACNAISMKKKRSDQAYDGLAHDEFGNYLISGSEQAIAFDADGNPTKWIGEVLTTQVLDPSNKDEFGECGFKEIPVPAHYSRRCSNPEAYILSGKPVACEHRYSFKVCPDCYADNDIAARHCVQCKTRLVDPNEKLTERAGQAGVMAVGETKILSCASVTYEPYQAKSGNWSLKTTYATEIGSVIAWHTVKQHWVFNRLAKANSMATDEIDGQYSQCGFWSVAPKAIKVKKSMGANDYAKFEVREVIFEERD